MMTLHRCRIVDLCYIFVCTQVFVRHRDKVDLDLSDKNAGGGALHYSAYNNNPEITKLLVSHELK